MNYLEFVNNKQGALKQEGFEIEVCNSGLFDWQKKCVEWALSRGRAALFEGCGLGKTRQQLVWANEICKRTGGNVLILAPLGVTRQTALEEAPEVNVKCTICRTQADVQKGVNITNYEMLEHFDSSQFVGCVLDESSILKNFMGSTRQKLVEFFQNTQYRLCCTATPAPNDYDELLNHADFLGIMNTAQSRSKYFINDMKTGTWRLKGHATKPFWEWVSTWALNIEKPSDIGFDDKGYILPELNEVVDVLEIDQISDDFENGFFRDIETSATSFRKEQSRTAEDRAKRCAEIMNDTEQYLIWCDTNEEADLLKKYIPDAVEVRGSDKPSFKEEAAEKFKSGEIRVLISKAKIFGFGMNFQKCHNVIFCGLNYSYESYYQALRRIYRFGQKETVNSTIVIGSTELHLLKSNREKEQKQRDMKNQMDLAIKDIQLLKFSGKEQKAEYKQESIMLPSWL